MEKFQGARMIGKEATSAGSTQAIVFSLAILLEYVLCHARLRDNSTTKFIAERLNCGFLSSDHPSV
jgi:hypothetical protein